MKKKMQIICLIISLLCLIISMKLLYNMGIFVDEYGLSPDIVLGGDFWLYMEWLRILLITILCIILFLNLKL